MVSFSGGNRKHNHQGMAQQFTGEHKNSLPWKEMLDFSTGSPGAESEEKNLYTSSEKVRTSSNKLLNFLFSINF